MNCDVGEATEWAELILQPFRHLTYVIVHSPTLPSLYLRHSSISNPSVASPTSQALHWRAAHVVISYSHWFQTSIKRLMIMLPLHGQNIAAIQLLMGQTTDVPERDGIKRKITDSVKTMKSKFWNVRIVIWRMQCVPPLKRESIYSYIAN